MWVCGILYMGFHYKIMIKKSDFYRDITSYMKKFTMNYNKSATTVLTSEAESTLL
jgi:hypothetical protein